MRRLPAAFSWVLVLLVACTPDPASQRHGGQGSAEADEPAADPEDAATAASGSAPTDAAPHAVIDLPDADRTAMGLEYSALEPRQLHPEERTFGRVVSDPSHSTTLHAPVAGTLLEGELLPAPGTTLAVAAVVFQLVPRWTPQDRADMALRLATARGDLAALEAELPPLRRALDRARTLNADEHSVSDRELEQTEGSLRVTEARAAGARTLVESLAALTADGQAAPLPLALPEGGEVVELFVRAGQAVEAGAPLLRVEDFRAPLVVVDLPADGSCEPDAPTARIEAGGPGASLSAERVGLAPTAGTAGLSPALMFRVTAGQAGAEMLRPGLRVTAWLPRREPPRDGLFIPRAAVVRLAGQACVYLRHADAALERRTLALEQPLDGGWFVDLAWLGVHGELPPELVVVGAQGLLSFELLGRQGEDED